MALSRRGCTRFVECLLKMAWYAVYWSQDNENNKSSTLPPSPYPFPPLLSRDLPLPHCGRGSLGCQRQFQYHSAVQIQLRVMRGTNSTILRDHLGDVIVCCYSYRGKRFSLLISYEGSEGSNRVGIFAPQPLPHSPGKPYNKFLTAIG